MSNRKAINEKPDRDQPDQYDEDLQRDNRRDAGSDGGSDTGRGDDRLAAGAGANITGEAGGPTNQQKDRKGQAQSPRELTHNEPPREKEGH